MIATAASRGKEQDLIAKYRSVRKFLAIATLQILLHDRYTKKKFINCTRFSHTDRAGDCRNIDLDLSTHPSRGTGIGAALTPSFESGPDFVNPCHCCRGVQSSRAGIEPNKYSGGSRQKPNDQSHNPSQDGHHRLLNSLRA
jgi:hypothetical protein